jgi:hypothetical protein
MSAPAKRKEDSKEIGGTYLVDVGQDTTTCDGRADKLVELFITSNG